MKEQIEELIQRGNLQKYVKRDNHPRTRTKDKAHDDVKDDRRDHPKQAMGEILMMTGGLVTRGSYRSLKKTYCRQVNSVHMKHLPPKYR